MNMNSDSEFAARPAADPAAPFWRLLALTYDALPMIPLLMGVSLLFLWLNGGRTVERQPLLQLATFATMWLSVGGYFVYSWRRGGQTMGMRPWRLRVVSREGGAASNRQLWLRYAVATLTPVFGLAWAFVDKERRALYDLAAGTAFVRLRAPAEAA
jgi:uncharacterized RDD family membrane protein YckC